MKKLDLENRAAKGARLMSTAYITPSQSRPQIPAAARQFF